VPAFSIVDWVIIAIVGASTLISLRRGFIREALSLVTLIAAMIVSRLFGAQAATLLVNIIEVDSVRNIAAYVGLFFTTLLVGGLVNSLVVQIVKVAGLSGLDKLLGLMFGFLRGGLIIVVVVAVLARIGFSDDAWWQGSVLIPSFVAFGDWIQMTGWDSASKMIEKVQST